MSKKQAKRDAVQAIDMVIQKRKEDSIYEGAMDTLKTYEKAFALNNVMEKHKARVYSAIADNGIDIGDLTFEEQSIIEQFIHRRGQTQAAKRIVKMKAEEERQAQENEKLEAMVAKATRGQMNLDQFKRYVESGQFKEEVDDLTEAFGFLMADQDVKFTDVDETVGMVFKTAEDEDGVTVNVESRDI